MSRTLSHIKRRSRLRAREGGAVIFIVSMTLALLATIGGFAMMSSSNEARTSGYERRALQSQYLAEYALLATANNLTADLAEEYKIMSFDTTRRATSCTNLRAVPIGVTTDESKACTRIGQLQLSQRWAAPADVALRAKAGGIPGALGLTDPNNTDGTGRPLGADFYVELTEPTAVVVPSGFSISGQNISWCSLRFTVDAFGITRTDLAANASTDTWRFLSTGVAVSHGQIVSPPRMCP